MIIKGKIVMKFKKKTYIFILFCCLIQLIGIKSAKSMNNSSFYLINRSDFSFKDIQAGYDSRSGKIWFSFSFPFHVLRDGHGFMVDPNVCRGVLIIDNQSIHFPFCRLREDNKGYILYRFGKLPPEKKSIEFNLYIDNTLFWKGKGCYHSTDANAIRFDWQSSELIKRNNNVPYLFDDLLKKSFKFYDSESFSYIIKTILDTTFQDSAGKMAIPHRIYESDLRLDTRFHADDVFFVDLLSISLKPRIHFQCNEGYDSVSSTNDINSFINEWDITILLTENIALTYGRENLQWGPSSLISPSNPFFTDNGRTKPKKEVNGMDFAKISWSLTQNLYLTLIGNFSKGLQEFPFPFSFQKTYAAKFDWLLSDSQFSIIASYKEKDRLKIGGFFQSLINDAFSVHGEGVIYQGENALYPLIAPETPNIKMENISDNSATINGMILWGGSYTFESGGKLTLEYLYHSAGYTTEQAALYNKLKKIHTAALSQETFPQAEYSQKQPINPGLKMLRKNYGLISYSQNDIFDKFALMFRHVQNMDDDSNQILFSVDYSMNDYFNLFVISTICNGREDTEYLSFIKKQFVLGIEYTF